MRRVIQRTLARAIETIGTLSRIVTGQPPGLGPMPLTFWLERNESKPEPPSDPAIANRGPEMALSASRRCEPGRPLS